MVINRDSENQFLFIAGTQLNIETSGFGSEIILLLIMSYSSTTMGSGWSFFLCLCDVVFIS